MQLEMNLVPRPRRVVVGFSGGVTSAWCAGWALRNFPRDEVVLLWHDTKEEHPDTYRFLREMAARLEMPITERSDGRSVTELFRDEGMLGNNQNTMCSRILKAKPGDEFRAGLRLEGFDVIKVLGYSANERKRVDRAVGHAAEEGIRVAFPVIAEGVTKQECADWCSCEMGVRPSAMYEYASHANCEGCVKGGREYFLATHKHRPHVFWQRSGLEKEFGHTIIRGGGPRSRDASRITTGWPEATGRTARVDRDRRMRVRRLAWVCRRIRQLTQSYSTA